MRHRLRVLLAVIPLTFGVVAVGAPVAQASAPSISVLTSNADTTNLTGSAPNDHYTTASIAPTANDLELAFISYFRTDGVNPTAPTLTSSGLTWVEEDASAYLTTGMGNRARLSVFRAMGASPSAGSVTIGFGSQPIQSVSYEFIEMGNVVTTGSNGSDAVVQSVPATESALAPTSGNLAAFASGDDRAVVGFAQNNSSTTFTPDTGWTNLANVGVGTPGNSSTVGWNSTSSSITNTTWGASTGAGGSVILEIKAVPVLTSDGFSWGSGTRGAGTDLDGQTTDVAVGGSPETWLTQWNTGAGDPVLTHEFEGLSTGVLQTAQVEELGAQFFDWAFVAAQHDDVEALVTIKLGATGGLSSSAALVLDAGINNTGGGVNANNPNGVNGRKNNIWCKIERTPGSSHNPDGLLQLDVVANGTQTNGDTHIPPTNSYGLPAYKFNSTDGMTTGNRYRLDFQRVGHIFTCTVTGLDDSVSQQITWDETANTHYEPTCVVGSTCTSDNPREFLKGSDAGIRTKTLCTGTTGLDCTSGTDNQDEDIGDTTYDDFVVYDLS